MPNDFFEVDVRIWAREMGQTIGAHVAQWTTGLDKLIEERLVNTDFAELLKKEVDAIVVREVRERVRDRAAILGDRVAEKLFKDATAKLLQSDFVTKDDEDE